jgi:signal transduction histidine kinase
MQMSDDLFKGLVAGSIIMMCVAVFTVILIIRYRQKQFQTRKQILNMQEKFHQEILQAQLEIREQTLKNIAQEIHDNIGQTLSLAKLNLGTIDPDKPEAASEKISGSKDLVSKAITDLRQLSKTLHADAMLSGGLIKAVQSDLGIIEGAGEIKTSFEIAGEAAAVDPKKELIIFRIIQEAISNIIRHSDATLIIIRMEFSGSDLHVFIADNGKGFNMNAHHGDGSGLSNMSNRAKIVGGQMETRSGSSGTEIKLIVPIN